MATPNPFEVIMGFEEPDQAISDGTDVAVEPVEQPEPIAPPPPVANVFDEIMGYEPEPPPELEAPPEELGTFANLWAGLKERGAGLVGDVGGFAQTAGQNLENAAGVMDWVPQLGGLVNDEEGFRYLNPKEWQEYNEKGGQLILRDFQEDWKNTSYGFTSDAAENWETVKSNPDLLEKAMALGAFSLEVGVISLADMAGAVLVPAPYLVARSEEIAQERATQDGREGAPTSEDMSIGFATASIITAMERFGFEQIASAFVKGGSTAQKILRGVVGEGGTEFVQEQLEYGAETLGTQAMPETGEEYAMASLERGLQGFAGGGPVGGVGAAIGAAVGTEEGPISDEVKTLEENRDAISRELQSDLTKRALVREQEGFEQDQRDMLESEEMDLARKIEEMDAQEVPFPTAAHAESKRRAIEKKYGETGLEVVQDHQGQWILTHRGKASMEKVLKDRQEKLGVGLRPAEEGQMEVDEMLEIATEPAPTTEGIEVDEDVDVEQINLEQTEGIDVTEISPEEITMKGGTTETGLEPVMQPLEWEGATRKEVEAEFMEEVWDNGAQAKRAADKLKEKFPTSTVEAALIDGEWKIVPRGRASMERVKQERAAKQLPDRQAEKEIEVTEGEEIDITEPAPTTEGIEVEEIPTEELGEGIPQIGVTEITEGEEVIDAPRKIYPGRPPKKPPDDDDGGGPPPPPGGGGTPLTPGIDDLDEAGLEARADEIDAELASAPRNIDIGSPDAAEAMDRSQSLQEEKRDIQDMLFTSHDQAKVREIRSEMWEENHKLNAGFKRYDTIEQMQTKLVDAENEQYKRDTARREELTDKDQETAKSKTTGKDIPVNYLDDPGYQDAIDAAEKRGEILIRGISQVEIAGEQIIRRKDAEPDTKPVVEPETAVEQTQEYGESPSGKPTTMRGEYEAEYTGKKIRPAGYKHSMDYRYEVKMLAGPNKGEHGYVDHAPEGIRAKSLADKETQEVEHPDVPGRMATDTLPDGTEYDLSKSAETQVSNTVGTYDNAKNEYFEDIDNGDILDYGAGKGLASKKHGFESLEPYPRGWTPTYQDTHKIARKYAAIIMNNILNVLPKHTRRAVLWDAAEKLEDGGRMYINVRSRGDVMSTKGIVKQFNDSEILTSRGTFQKGFQRAELIKFIEAELGPDYTVESAKFGSVAVLVTKKPAAKAKVKIGKKKPGKGQRATDAQVKYMLEFGMIQNESQADEFMDLANMLGVKIKDGSKFPGNLAALRARAIRTGDPKLDKKLYAVYEKTKDKRDFTYHLRIKHPELAAEMDAYFVSQAEGPVREMVHVLENHRKTASNLWEGVSKLGDIEFVKALNGDSKGKFGWHVMGSDRLFHSGRLETLKQAKLEFQKEKKTAQGKNELKAARDEARPEPEHPPTFQLYGKKLPAAEKAFGKEFMEKTTQHPLLDDARVLMNPAQANSEDFAIIEIEPFGSSGGILVKTVQSSRTRKGNGNAAINFLIDLANEHGIELMLDANAYGELENRLNQKQLEGWYKRKGFEKMPDYEGMLIYKPNLLQPTIETVITPNPKAKASWPWVAVDHNTKAIWGAGATQEEASSDVMQQMASKHESVEAPDKVDYIQVPPETDLDMNDDVLYKLATSKDQRLPPTPETEKKRKRAEKMEAAAAPGVTSPLERKGNRLYLDGKAINKWDVLTIIENEYASHPGEYIAKDDSYWTTQEVFDFFTRRYNQSLEPTQTEPTDPEAQRVAESFLADRPWLKGMVLSHKPGDERNGVTLVHYYGEILMTEDKDGMPIDVVLNQEHVPGDDTPVYIANAATKKGKFEQHKVMVGFKSEADATEGFQEQWPGRDLNSVERITPEAFAEWKTSRDTKVEYNREQWLGRMNKGKDLSKPVTGDNVLTAAQLAKSSTSAITDISPWLLADGSVVETGSDHLGYATERGIIGRKKSVAPVAEFQKKGGAVRAAYFGETDDLFDAGAGKTFAWLHLHSDQKLTEPQINALEDFFRETRKLKRKPSVLIGRSPDGSNPETVQIGSIAELRRWNENEVKEPTPEYGESADAVLRGAGRGDLAWGPAPEPSPMTEAEVEALPQPEEPTTKRGPGWEPVPELERPPEVDIGGVLEASTEAPGDATELSNIPLTAEAGDRKVTHNAKWWKDAIDKRLTSLNKIRGCA